MGDLLQFKPKPKQEDTVTVLADAYCEYLQTATFVPVGNGWIKPVKPPDASA